MENTVSTRVRFGEFGLELNSGQLSRGGETIYLPEKPFRLLVVLIEYEGGLVSREDIKKKLWPNDTAVDFEHGINTAIKSLRRSLGDSADQPTYIETVPRRGYRLMVPVERVADSVGPTNGQAVGNTQDTPGSKTPRGGLVGRTVSHYRVLEVIGGGGMGVVYRAEDLKLGRAVALKFLPEDLGNDPLALERFSREARSASSLDHSNICVIHEFGEHEGHPFIVMPLLEGQTLRDRLAASKGPLPLNEVVDIAIQVAQGLQAAHERGIIHRDIKPANIFITSKGVCKILDFGLAKLLETEEPEEAMAAANAKSSSASGQPIYLTLTRTGTAMGTAAYMSPEQVRGENLDARTDIFSFGLVLYESATGARAYSGETAAVVQEKILHQAAAPAAELNAALPADLISILNKALDKDRKARYQSASELLRDLEQLKRDESRWFRLRSHHNKVLAGAAALFFLASGAVAYWRFHRPAPEFKERDGLVLADFANTTGDKVFDDTLRRALALQLEQSPYFDVLPEGRLQATLQQMEKSSQQVITPEIAQEICVRTGSRAVLGGSIAPEGNSFHILLRALSCQTGHQFETTNAVARDRNDVLPALSLAATQMRQKLGESLASVQKFDQPLPEATTSSLEALQAYAKTRSSHSSSETIPLLKRAIELDPNFALAYAHLGAAYWNVGQGKLGAENIKKAYELRHRTSERERFYIEASYYAFVTRELDKAEQSAKEWARNYPADPIARKDLAILYTQLGRPDDAVREIQEAVRLAPDSPFYGDLVGMLSAAGRLPEAKAAYDKAIANNLDNPTLHEYRYGLAFLQGDEAGMREQVAWALAKPRTEDNLLAGQSSTEIYYGRLKKGREFAKRAVESDIRADALETASIKSGFSALSEAELGNGSRARGLAEEALKQNPGRDGRMWAAFALARAGYVNEAQSLADELNREFPVDTLMQNQALPSIRAAIHLRQDKPLQALEVLEVVRPYELSQDSIACMYPAYLRGEAYLQAHYAEKAVTEFEKLFTYRGIVSNLITGALVHLQIARAYAMMGDKDAARKSYQEFLTLWKDADPDLPTYQQAKAEYARLN
jgi:serine/threonine protein kinase/predicted Zn-dependent protease